MEIFVHKTAEVSEGAVIGRGTSIWQHCIIQSGAQIGENCNVGANVFIEDGVIIGNGVKIKNNIALYSGVVCEDDVFLGPNCVFTNVINPRSHISRKNEFRRTVVKKGAAIGANATIVCGHVIGKYAMIGAGTVVEKDIKDYELAVGNPARKKGYVCECGCRITDRLQCSECGKAYEMKDGVMEEASLSKSALKTIETMEKE